MGALRRTNDFNDQSNELTRFFKESKYEQQQDAGLMITLPNNQQVNVTIEKVIDQNITLKKEVIIESYNVEQDLQKMARDNKVWDRVFVKQENIAS